MPRSPSVSEQVRILLSADDQDASNYFDELIKRVGGAVRVGNSLCGRGKGLFATQDVEAETVILKETPLAAFQEMDNKADTVVCSHCLKHLGSLEYQLSWWLMNKKEDDCQGADENHEDLIEQIQDGLMDGSLKFPFAEDWNQGPPVMCTGNCGDLYCSLACKNSAWEEYHSLLCTGPVENATQRRKNTASASLSDSVEMNRTALREFEIHALQTNPIFLLGARVIAKVLGKALELVEASGSSVRWSSESVRWASLQQAWTPFKHAWKKVWWEAVALPDDVENQEEFREQLRKLVTHSSELLRSAFTKSKRFPALFQPEVFGSIIGMFEQNNLEIDISSPLELFLEEMDEDQHKDFEDALPGVKDLISRAAECPLEGTGYFSLACCTNHSCCPNVLATRRAGEDVDGDVVLIALRDIKMGEELTISYIDISLDYEERAKLLTEYGFTCKCKKCLQEENAD